MKRVSLLERFEQLTPQEREALLKRLELPLRRLLRGLDRWRQEAEK